jgi:hypothetical protein
MKKFLGHLWYLSEELVAFAFFDNEVSLTTERKMVDALNNEGVEHPLKCINLDPDLIDFVSSNTLRFFSAMGVPSEFLENNVEIWEEDEVYKRSREIVRAMRVVNDIAERGAALMEEYNKLHTTNEEQKQYLLLLVKQYRQKYPDTKKSTLLP